MGRPTLSEKEISILKCLPSIPKYYLSKSEDNDILLPEGAKEKRLCTVIRRLEAELMSRDFWMQSWATTPPMLLVNFLPLTT